MATLKQSLQDKELRAVTGTRGRWQWRAAGCCEGYLTECFVILEGLVVGGGAKGSS